MGGAMRVFPIFQVFQGLSVLPHGHLRNRKNENGSNTFKFAWSKEGRIFCRTEQQSKPGLGQKLPKPGIVNKPSDLMKLGFTEQEVKDIVCNKRK